MKILAVGGGSGGHVTPVVAVLRELKQRRPEAEICFWCDVKFAPQARALIKNFDSNLSVQTIVSGKLRRYHHLSVVRQLLLPTLVLLNIRDGFLVFVGFLQSLMKLVLWRPDVVFTKGGYVCLPVGLAAKILGIPLVIHDSDAHPGLTNSILSKWATSIATGAPLEYYSYPKTKSRYVGIPISSEFHPFSSSEKQAARELWGINTTRPLIVVTGGGLGAQRINDVVVTTLTDLLKLGSVVLVAGTGQYDELRSITPPNDEHFQLHAFVSRGMADLLGAADVVVTRAGATTILELAALAKPTILIPNGKLTGGHQLKNAAVYADAHAVAIVDERTMTDEPIVLARAIDIILTEVNESDVMAKKFSAFARPRAASDMADMILDAAK
ncbi:UDP-N-acetylglucosamine--N-acetylmuramyl-(pentapeptide) pyrophosphoryl-undecaprenol N-acetylglucosamine transferase [Candidatus Saccharibacteria bacterium]|nr:UDP-N-acetylglucosamine--N-acetylmuramyl-(pentapeptide) pyrophosphoryl-undecaprenol N-acetylglucosamine transferase [Candidatus Saccharibacteria bacterium]